MFDEIWMHLRVGQDFFLHDYAWATEKNNLIHKMSFLLHFIIFEYLSAVKAM